MKIPFNIKFRPQIESGEYKVETKDGNSIRILAWDLPYNFPIATAEFTEDNRVIVESYSVDGWVGYGEKENNLVIITPEPELSEFELKVREILYSDKQEYSASDPESWKRASSELLELARKEIMDGWSKGLRDTQDLSGKAYNDGYQLGFEQGKAEALKGLPRWIDDAIAYLEKQKELTRENVIKELEKEFYECGTTPKWFHNAMQGAINYGKATALGEIKPPTVNIEKQKEQKSYEPHNWPANKDNLTQEQKHTNSEKPKEWSEEDETAYGDLIWCIEQAKKSAKDENDMGNIWFVENWIKNRIKSLRPQPKQNWSEEDEDKVDDICKLIEHATIIPRSGDDDTGIPPTRLNDKYKGELKAFVKYLRNRLTKSDTWKPSEEQMAVLYDAISDLKHDNYKNTDVLESLYNDLKKLSYEIY